eukprot:Skav229236  [mRNA]  locus=scaffold2154:35724:40914:+ [translate_table: standard]
MCLNHVYRCRRRRRRLRRRRPRSRSRNSIRVGVHAVRHPPKLLQIACNSEAKIPKTCKQCGTRRPLTHGEANTEAYRVAHSDLVRSLLSCKLEIGSFPVASSQFDANSLTMAAARNPRVKEYMNDSQFMQRINALMGMSSTGGPLKEQMLMQLIQEDMSCFYTARCAQRGLRYNKALTEDNNKQTRNALREAERAKAQGGMLVIIHFCTMVPYISIPSSSKEKFEKAKYLDPQKAEEHREKGHAELPQSQGIDWA